MKLLPILLINVVTVGVALFVYEQVRDDPEAFDLWMRYLRRSILESSEFSQALFDRYFEIYAQFADRLVAQIVGVTRTAGRYDDALIVVLSDHGEAFLEHDEFLHTTLLYEEFVRVPLVVKWPAEVDAKPPTRPRLWGPGPRLRILPRCWRPHVPTEAQSVGHAT